MRNLTLLTGVFGILSLATLACGSSSYDAGDDSPGPSGTVAPGGGNVAPDAAVPPGCDVTKAPSQDACVVNETLGVFVAPPQADADAIADGTRAHPFRTMQAGIDAAKAAGKRVYASVGTYPEQITLADGVSMFGDLDVDQSWAVVSANAQVKAPSSPAARADGIKTATRVEHIDLVAPDGSASATSSIALLATASPALTIASATIHAGKGFKGADGVEGAQLTNSPSANGQDNSAALLEDCSRLSSNPTPCSTRHRTPASGGINTCNGAGLSVLPTLGAPGGTGIGDAVVASSTTFFEFAGQYYMTPTYLATNGGAAGPAAGGVKGTGQGAVGASGAPGANGTNGASAAAAGMITEQGFVPADGSAGTNGGSGQGGGGGAGYDYITQDSTSFASGDAIYFANGGGGGAGGCPGLAGTSGKGGGASIAIIAAESPLTLDACILQASDGGDGGAGTFGSQPTAGGSGGLDQDPLACRSPRVCLHNYVSHDGGNGGSGGSSGWSGSGAGGSSIGIAYRGGQVVLVNGTAPTIGNAGKGVAAMTKTSKTIPASADGAAGLTLSF